MNVKKAKQTLIRRRLLCAMSCALTGVTLSLASFPVAAQGVKERNLKFAFSLAKDHPLGMGAQKFSDLVEFAREVGEGTVVKQAAAELVHMRGGK